MRILKTILISLISIISYSQITLEHTYNNSSTLAASSQSEDKQPLMVKLEVDNMKYIFIDRQAKTVTFYNMDHTFFKTISFASATNLTNLVSVDILYISQHLFDLDDEIEFMYSHRYFNGSTFTCVTQIINEDGSIIFTENGAPLVKANYHQQQYPIYNTDSGTKLMLSMNNSDVNIYSLQGDLTAAIVPLIDEKLYNFAYPNPSENQINIPLDQFNNESNTILELFDQNGKLIRTMNIDPDIDELKLNIQNLSPGIFYYQVNYGNKRSKLREFIKK